MAPFGRVLTAMVTPFDADGGVDYRAAARLAAHLVDSGSDGLVVTGSTGEGATLERREKVRLWETVADAVGDRAWVLAGTGTNATADSVALTRDAERVGVRGVMAVVPYYNKPPQEGLYRHFAAIAEATSLPVMLYNVPPRTGLNMPPATVARLAGIPNVVALKEAAGSLDQVSELVTRVPPEFAIYSGDDSMTLGMCAVGAVGVVSVASHLVGRAIQEMLQAHSDGRPDAAAAVHRRLFPLFRALFVVTNPVPVKTALRWIGMEVGGFRLPLSEADPVELEPLRRAMEALDLLPAGARAGGTTAPGAPAAGGSGGSPRSAG